MCSLAVQSERVNVFSNLGMYDDSISQTFLIEEKFKLKKNPNQTKPPQIVLTIKG